MAPPHQRVTPGDFYNLGRTCRSIYSLMGNDFVCHDLGFVAGEVGLPGPVWL